MSEYNANSPMVDTSRAHPARIYDYALGGKDHYPVDEDAALQLEALFPGTLHAARCNRAFLRRAAAHLAGLGIKQYLDIGTGIPNEPNLHDTVWARRPDAKIVYVDNDPTVLSYAEPFVKRAGGRAEYVHADAIDTHTIITRAKRHLDFTKPVSLSVVALWHFISDEYTPLGSNTTFRPAEAMAELIEALPSGSYVTLSHATSDLFSDGGRSLVAVYRDQGIDAQARSHEEVSALFGGLDLVEPGLVEVDHWHPEPGDVPGAGAPVPVYAGLARKP